MTLAKIVVGVVQGNRRLEILPLLAESIGQTGRSMLLDAYD